MRPSLIAVTETETVPYCKTQNRIMIDSLLVPATISVLEPNQNDF